MLALLDHLSKTECKVREAILIWLSCSISRIIWRLHTEEFSSFKIYQMNFSLIFHISPTSQVIFCSPSSQLELDPKPQTLLLLPVLPLTFWPTQSKHLPLLSLHYLASSKRKPGLMISYYWSNYLWSYSGPEIWATSFMGHSAEYQNVKKRRRTKEREKKNDKLQGQRYSQNGFWVTLRILNPTNFKTPSSEKQLLPE